MKIRQFWRHTKASEKQSYLVGIMWHTDRIASKNLQGCSKRQTEVKATKELLVGLMSFLLQSKQCCQAKDVE